MTTIAILHRKGGVGKTTIATNLARAFQFGGLSVVLVDTDPQGTARDWAAVDDSDGLDVPLPLTVGVDRPTLEREVPRLAAGGTDVVVIDGAAKVARLTASAIRAADLVLIPVQPSAFDAWPVEDVVEIVRERQAMTATSEDAEGHPTGGRPACALVLSRTIAGTTLSRTARDAYAPLGLPVLDGTAQRVAYAEAAGRGLSVLDIEPAGKAAAEVIVLARAVAKLAGLAYEPTHAAAPPPTP